jgi:methyltransferase (TIGR00027 family)
VIPVAAELMSDRTSWKSLLDGVGCPLDAPRPASNDHWDLVATLSVSSLYLSRNQTYRGQCQLVFDPRHVARLDQLSGGEWIAFATDLHVAQRALMRVARPDHVNVEILGNVVPHLHAHIIPRYVGDPMWGAPIWQVPLESMPDKRLPGAERTALIEAIRRALAGPDTDMTGVGLTSRWVAANRALETERPEPLYRDPFARELAGEAGFEMLFGMRAVLGMSGYTGPDPFLTIRTKFFDDALLAAVRDTAIDQVVILAAGMDARAFRLKWPRDVTVFEVDRDDVFTHKAEILHRLGSTPTCARRVVLEDLAGGWTNALASAGFDRTRPAAFLAEGLLYYLDEAAVGSLFGSLAESAATGSWLGLDAMSPDVLTTPFMAGYLNRLAELGCPWRSAMADPDAFLAAHGWRSTCVLPGEPEAHYGRWVMPLTPRSVPGVPRTFLVRATRVS